MLLLGYGTNNMLMPATGHAITLLSNTPHGKRYVVRAVEKLTALLELESAIRSGGRPEDCVAHEICLDKLSPCW